MGHPKFQDDTIRNRDCEFHKTHISKGYVRLYKSSKASIKHEIQHRRGHNHNHNRTFSPYDCFRQLFYMVIVMAHLIQPQLNFGLYKLLPLAPLWRKSCTHLQTTRKKIQNGPFK